MTPVDGPILGEDGDPTLVTWQVDLIQPAGGVARRVNAYGSHYHA